MKKRLLALAVTLLLLAALAVPVFAIDPMDLNASCSLTVSYVDGDLAMSGVEFWIYKVADPDEFAEFTLSGDFADIPVAVNSLDSEGWLALAQTLEGFAADMTPLRSGVTDRFGQVTFDDLDVGLYLVIGEVTQVVYEEDDETITVTYRPQPIMVSLPNHPADDPDAWEYDVVSVTKFDTVQEETVDRRVIKVWDDAGMRDERPNYIYVQLLQDGEIYDRVRLDEETNWRYEWTDLEADHRWTIQEEEIDASYTVTVTREGTTFVLTNSAETPPPPAPPPPPDDPPPPDNPPPPDEPPPPDNPPPPEEPPIDIGDDPVPQGNIEVNEPEPEYVIIEDEPVPQGEKLPQTGLMWWPVPVLLMAGLALIILGLNQKRRAADEG